MQGFFIVHCRLSDPPKKLAVLLGLRHIVEVFPDPNGSGARIQTTHSQIQVEESYEQVLQLIQNAGAAQPTKGY